MAKGDCVEVTTTQGVTMRIEAARGGRRLVSSTHTRSKLQWLDVEEVTRGGRPTGTCLRVRLDQLACIRELTATEDPAPIQEPVVVKRQRRKRVEPESLPMFDGVEQAVPYTEPFAVSKVS